MKECEAPGKIRLLSIAEAAFLGAGSLERLGSRDGTLGKPQKRSDSESGSARLEEAGDDA